MIFPSNNSKIAHISDLPSLWINNFFDNVLNIFDDQRKKSIRLTKNEINLNYFKETFQLFCYTLCFADNI